MQLKSLGNKLGCFVVSSNSLAAVIIGIGTTSASAQITIQSTGTLSGTIQLPSFNPNFNNRVTRVDTDSSGTYYRQGVPVYKSDFVKVGTRRDGSLHYFVDFKGIPVVSFDGVLTSPVLSGGELTPYTYQGKLPGTKFQGVVQDEFGLTKAFYTGTVTDPKTGQQYQGTFELNGQGPRYSDRNGGASPTVFDFKSDQPGNPTVRSLQMTDTPLVKLRIIVPASATPINPGDGGSTPAPVPPVPAPVPEPVPAPVSVVPTPVPSVLTPVPPVPAPVPSVPTPVLTPVQSVPTPVPAPVQSVPTPVPTPVPRPVPRPVPTPVSVVPAPVPSVPTPVVPAPAPVVPAPVPMTSGSNTSSASPTSPTPTLGAASNSPSPSAAPNVEFSSGNSLTVNQVVEDPSTLGAICSRDSGNCTTRPSAPKQAIGPRSRVLLR